MTETIAVAGGELTYTVAGDGPPAAFFHQYSAVSVDDPLGSTLTPYVRLHAISPRDLGGSGPVRGDDDLTMTSFADDLHRARRNLGISRWIAIGSSTGGMTALLHALADPSALRGLVVIGAAASHRFIEGSIYSPTHPKAPDLQQAFPPAMSDPIRYAETVFRLSVADPDATPVPDGWGTTEFSMRRMMAFSQNLPAFDIESRLSAITCPALVLVGRHDPQCPLAESERIAAALPNARLHVFERSGHFPYLEEPQEFDSVFGSWVHSLEAT